jgi:hypothetical protein
MSVDEKIVNQPYHIFSLNPETVCERVRLLRRFFDSLPTLQYLNRNQLIQCT